MSSPYKRRIVVINKPLQYRFTAWVVGTVVLAVMIFFVDVFVSLHQVTSGMETQLGLFDLYDPRNPFTLVKFLLYFTGVFVASLLLSHRVAGPAYRIGKSAEEVAGGNLTHKVFLRQKDEFLDLRDTFNFMVDALRGKVAGDVSCAFRAKKQLEALLEDETLSNGTVDKVKRAITEMERVGKDFKI